MGLITLITVNSSLLTTTTTTHVDIYSVWKKYVRESFRLSSFPIRFAKEWNNLPAKQVWIFSNLLFKVDKFDTSSIY